MKNRNTIITAIVLALLLVGIYFVSQTDPLDLFGNSDQQQDNTPESASEDEQTPGKITTEYFTIDIPNGWQQVQPNEGIEAMAINLDEEITDPAAKKVSFRTYLAISKDVLNGKTMAEYIQVAKAALSEKIPNIVFTQEEDITINDSSAHTIEMELTQEEINFRTLMVVIADYQGNAWAASFNTTKDNWEGYRDLFYSTANSFSLLQ